MCSQVTSDFRWAWGEKRANRSRPPASVVVLLSPTRPAGRSPNMPDAPQRTRCGSVPGWNPTTAPALSRTMPNRGRLSRELWLLRCELAEIRAQADEQRHQGAWWREEMRRVIAQPQELVAASRRQRQERADAEDE